MTTKEEHIGAAEAAEALGLERRGRRWGPCPACGSHGDRRRGAVVTNGPRWFCARCGEKGDGVNLVSWILSSRKDDYRAAFAWLKDRDPLASTHTPYVEEPRERLPVADLAALLRACTPARECRDADYLAHCERKGVDPAKAPGGILPPPGHPVYARTRLWWPGHRSKTWRIVLPAWDHAGRLKSMHVRATDPEQKPKTLWPGVAKEGFPRYDNGGVFFADDAGRDFLRGHGPRTVIAVEGFSDFFAACTQPTDAAILGIESGSSDSLRLASWPQGSELFCATHADDAGDKYAATIVAAVQPLGVPVYRIPLMRA